MSAYTPGQIANGEVEEDSYVDVDGFKVFSEKPQSGKMQQFGMKMPDDSWLNVTVWTKMPLNFKGKTLNLKNARVSYYEPHDKWQLDVGYEDIEVVGSASKRATPKSRPKNKASGQSESSDGIDFNDAWALVMKTKTSCREAGIDFHFDMSRFVNCLIMQGVKVETASKDDIPF